MAIKNKIVVIGCGRFGSSVANLASERGENVIVVDPVSSSFERLDDNFSGYKVTGDATDVSLLKKTPISRRPAKSRSALATITSIFS
jgi:trk system potassium uptake protein TrkA